VKQWTGDVPGSYSKEEVQEYCVLCYEWQCFRANVLKGCSTERKLEWLKEWYDTKVDRWPRRTRVQVDNYLNALKRGGQLSMDLVVQR